MTDRLEHIKTTPEGFTHWSSGPSNRIFDPQCGACWQEEVERLRGELADLQLLHDSEQEMRIFLAKEINPKLDEMATRAGTAIKRDETIATLRRELDKQIDLNEGYVDTATALREALENEWEIAHNDYCGCSLDGRIKCDHPKPKALATEAPQ